MEKLFYEYFDEWVDNYKAGTVAQVTLEKYKNNTRRIRELAPDMKMGDLNRSSYQNLINKFAETHEETTVRDFHHHLRSCLLDAFDDGAIERDPTRKTVIKGCMAKRKKKPKFLGQEELQKLMSVLELGDRPNTDWFIWLIAKTGARFSEALALTAGDFDFVNRKLKICKTWDYKHHGGFTPTKNKSSNRMVELDWETIARFSVLLKGMEPEQMVFVEEGKNIYSTTYNDRLERLCRKAGVKVISMHGLRHTHASVLFAAGVSIPSVAKRLGHSNTATTQKVYLHVITELERKDNSLIQGVVAGITAR